MITGLWIFIYTVFIFAGIRYLRTKKGRKREQIGYVCGILWCVYLTVGKLHNWPSFSITEPVNVLFSPAGHWLEQILGGSPN